MLGLPLEWRLLGIGVLVLSLFSAYEWKLAEARREGRSTCEQQHQAAAAAEERRRVQALSEVANEAQRMANRTRGDADVARAALERLRDRAARGDGLRVARPAAASAPASAAADLSSDVLGRLGEAARQLAQIADDRGVAGDACEAAYDALENRPKP